MLRGCRSAVWSGRYVKPESFHSFRCTRALPAKTRWPPKAKCISRSDHRLSGKRLSTLFGYVPPGGSRRATKAGRCAQSWRKEPFRLVQTGQKGTAKTASLRFYQLHWRRGVDAAIPLPSPSDLGPDACPNWVHRSVTEPVSRARPWHLSTFFEIHRPGQHRRVGPQRDPSEPAVIAHWRADPIV
jgi:hypothetical protein